VGGLTIKVDILLLVLKGLRGDFWSIILIFLDFLKFFGQCRGKKRKKIKVNGPLWL